MPTHARITYGYVRNSNIQIRNVEGIVTIQGGYSHFIDEAKKATAHHKNF